MSLAGEFTRLCADDYRPAVVSRRAPSVAQLRRVFYFAIGSLALQFIGRLVDPFKAGALTKPDRAVSEKRIAKMAA